MTITSCPDCPPPRGQCAICAAFDADYRRWAEVAAQGLTCLYCEGPLRPDERAPRARGGTQRLHIGMCVRAYFADRKAASRARLRGEPDAEPALRPDRGWWPRVYPETCTAAGCLGAHQARGLCRMHYDRARRCGPVTPC